MDDDDLEAEKEEEVGESDDEFATQDIGGLVEFIEAEDSENDDDNDDDDENDREFVSDDELDEEADNADDDVEDFDDLSGKKDDEGDEEDSDEGDDGEEEPPSSKKPRVTFHATTKRDKAAAKPSAPKRISTSKAKSILAPKSMQSRPHIEIEYEVEDEATKLK